MDSGNGSKGGLIQLSYDILGGQKSKVIDGSIPEYTKSETSKTVLHDFTQYALFPQACLRPHGFVDLISYVGFRDFGHEMNGSKRKQLNIIKFFVKASQSRFNTPLLGTPFSNVKNLKLGTGRSLLLLEFPDYIPFKPVWFFDRL